MSSSQSYPSTPERNEWFDKTYSLLNNIKKLYKKIVQRHDKQVEEFDKHADEKLPDYQEWNDYFVRNVEELDQIEIEIFTIEREVNQSHFNPTQYMKDLYPNLKNYYDKLSINLHTL